jgi:hypothetical protein
VAKDIGCMFDELSFPLADHLWIECVWQDKNMDVPKPQKETKASEKPARRGFQRGADYFGGASHVES